MKIIVPYFEGKSSNGIKKEFLKSEPIMWHRRERGETQVEHTELLREVDRYVHIE